MAKPPYRPLDAQVSPRFSGLRTFMRLPYTTDLAGVNLAVVGIPFDTATSFRSGARFGPVAVRALSAILAVPPPARHRCLRLPLRGRLRRSTPSSRATRAGALELAAEGLAALLEADVFPLVLGGDHTVSLAELRA